MTSRLRTRASIVVCIRTSATFSRRRGRDVVDVVEIPAIVRDQRIDEQNLGAEIDQLPGEVAADEPDAAGDHDPAAAVVVL